MSEHAATVEPEGGIEPDDLNTTTIVVVALISTALLLASVLGVTALVEGYGAYERAEKVLTPRADAASSALTEQRDTLNAWGYDAGKGTYQIPIEEAKKLVVDEFRRERSTQ